MPKYYVRSELKPNSYFTFKHVIARNDPKTAAIDSLAMLSKEKKFKFLGKTIRVSEKGNNSTSYIEFNTSDIMVEVKKKLEEANEK